MTTTIRNFMDEMRGVEVSQKYGKFSSCPKPWISPGLGIQRSNYERSRDLRSSILENLAQHKIRSFLELFGYHNT